MKIRFLHMVENEWVDLQDPFQTQGTKSRMKCNYICLVPFSEAIFRVYSLSGSEESTEKPFCFTSKPSRSLTAFSPLVPGGLVPAGTPRATESKPRGSACPRWPLWSSFSRSPRVWMSLGTGWAKSGRGEKQEE